MRPSRLQLFLAALFLLPTPLVAMAGDKTGPAIKPPAGSGLVEVRYANGSVIVMTLRQDSFEIVTAYGKLTVPSNELRQIDFGIHSSAAEDRKIDDALKRLGSDVAAERESAVEELVALGAPAFVRLINLAPGADPEAARRAEMALKQLREKYPPRVLRPRTDDIVRTTRFTIIGRIVTPVFKGKAEDIGELELRPGRLLTIRALSDDTQKEVVVDAAKFGDQGSTKWLATGIQVSSYRGLRITATGQVDQWPQQPGQYLCGPDGTGNGNGNVGAAMIVNGKVIRNQAARGALGGALMGRVGESGLPFVIGSSHARAPRTTGQLYLQIAPSPWGCPSTGEYRVTITSGPFAGDQEPDE